MKLKGVDTVKENSLSVKTICILKSIKNFKGDM